MPLAVFLIALALRAVYLSEMRGHPLFEFLVGDGDAYDQWARRIAGGAWRGDEVFYQAPLYPYFLAVVYSIAGKSLMAARVAQSILGAAACGLLAAGGRRFLSPGVGLVAGLALAVYPTAVFSDGLIQKSALDNFFTCLLIFLLSRTVIACAGADAALTPAPAKADAPSPARATPHPALWLAVGAVAGCLALTRENALALVPVLLLAGWLGGKPLGGDLLGAGRLVEARSARASLARVGLLALGLLLTLGPVAARNKSVDGQWHLTTSQFGPNFYIGNNPDSVGSYMPLRPGHGTAAFERSDAVELAEAALGRKLTAGEVSGHWFEQSLKFIRAEPTRWLTLMGRKALLLANRIELVDTDSQTIYAQGSMLLTFLDQVMGFGLLLSLAAVGAVIHWRAWPRLWPLGAIAAAYAGSVVLFYVVARYRFPLVPLLALFAAAGLVDGLRLLQTRGLRPLLGPLLVGAAALGLACVPVVSAEEELANGEYNLGKLLLDRKRDPQAAIPHLLAAVQGSPAFAEARDAVGVALTRTNHPLEAIPFFMKAIELNGDYIQARFHLALALQAVGDTAPAIAQLEAVLKANPNDAAAHLNLGSMLAGARRFPEAIEHYRTALRLEPDTEDALNNLGIALASIGQMEPARAEFEHALRINPDNPETFCNYGIVLLRLGRAADAAKALERAQRFRPEDPLIRQNLDKARAAAGL